MSFHGKDKVIHVEVDIGHGVIGLDCGCDFRAPHLVAEAVKRHSPAVKMVHQATLLESRRAMGLPDYGYINQA